MTVALLAEQDLKTQPWKNLIAGDIQLITIAANNIAGRQDIANPPPAVNIDMMFYDPMTQLLGFRVLSSGASWISYVDMSQQNPLGRRGGQVFDQLGQAKNRSLFQYSSLCMERIRSSLRIPGLKKLLSSTVPS